MPNTISFRGDTIWEDGPEFNLTPGGMGEDAVEARSQTGTGYWIKPAGFSYAEHRLDLVFATSDPGALRESLNDMATAVLGTLAVPGWGSFTKCRLLAPSDFSSFKSDDATGYIVRVTLTFREYP